MDARSKRKNHCENEKNRNCFFEVHGFHLKNPFFKNYKNAFQELEKGNLDAISTDATILQGLVLDNPEYKILPDRYSTEFYGIALRKESDSENLKNAINF